MSPPVVVLGACTLYPAALRDILMRLALHQLILARWTDAIHNEWIEAVLRDRSDLTRERLQRRTLTSPYSIPFFSPNAPSRTFCATDPPPIRVGGYRSAGNIPIPDAVAILG